MARQVNVPEGFFKHGIQLCPGSGKEPFELVDDVETVSPEYAGAGRCPDCPPVGGVHWLGFDGKLPPHGR